MCKGIHIPPGAAMQHNADAEVSIQNPILSSSTQYYFGKKTLLIQYGFYPEDILDNFGGIFVFFLGLS